MRKWHAETVINNDVINVLRELFKTFNYSKVMEIDIIIKISRMFKAKILYSSDSVKNR